MNQSAISIAPIEAREEPNAASKKATALPEGSALRKKMMKPI
jgi:hypothetical protein